MGEWYTLAMASKICGKSREYFTRKYREKPEFFEGVEVQTLAGRVFVSENGLEVLKTRAKKRGDHQKPETFDGLKKQAQFLLFSPTAL